MSVHAICSPSGRYGWERCLGKPAMEKDCPDSTSPDAALGIAAHELAAMALEDNRHPFAFKHSSILVNDEEFIVDHDMATHVAKYTDFVNELANGKQLLVEQSLSMQVVTTEEGSRGTADAVILDVDAGEIIVVDLKYGLGVAVDAYENPQLEMYGIAALHQYSVLAEFNQVRMIIVQPRLDSISEWVMPADKLMDRRVGIMRTAIQVLDIYERGATVEDLNPGEKQCRFCRVKATCPALTKTVMAAVADDFVDLDKDISAQLSSAQSRIELADEAHIANCMSAVDLIEQWCKAVRARAESDLLAGKQLPGWKLVEGRRGARKWVDEASAVEALRQMRLKHEQMYEYSVISPTAAEKLTKTDVIGPRQWQSLQQLITQSEGKPSVAPESDKRPALQVSASVADFESLA